METMGRFRVGASAFRILGLGAEGFGVVVLGTPPDFMVYPSSSIVVPFFWV